MFENRKYVVVFYSEIDQIDFTQVMETSAETVRRSTDGNLTFVKYEGEMPSSVVALTNKSQEFTHEQFLIILAGPDWTAPMEEIP
jgi:hypothetical protein